MEQIHALILLQGWKKKIMGFCKIKMLVRSRKRKGKGRDCMKDMMDLRWLIAS
jgi:hypothetical protein